MKDAWIDHCLTLAQAKPDMYSGCRKILRNRHLTFSTWRDDLHMLDAGFTKSKMSMLIRNYKNDASIKAALMLWKERLVKKKYGSVGMSTYNHYVKGNIDGASPRGSKMGPCIQGVTLTLLDKQRVAVDVFYRTTEFFKKFPADLVFLRDILLEPFEIPHLEQVNFHFANITCHPMYFVTILPHLDDPIEELDKLRRRDPRFFEWTVKWTARYICKEHNRGIAKFAQALRVQQDALNRIPSDDLRDLRKYFNKHHPGYRNDYTAPEEDEE